MTKSVKIGGVAVLAAVIGYAGAVGAPGVDGLRISATQIALTAVGAPYPRDPSLDLDLPTADQLLRILRDAEDPGVPFAAKSNLVEGGLSPHEARLADARLQEAVAHGELPLTATVANIHSTGPHEAAADFTISGPKLSPVTENLTFVDQLGWKLSRSSAVLLMQQTNSADG